MFTKSKENKTIFSNFISLSFLQGANLLLPLITFPYLVRSLGIETYGLIMFAQAFIAYFSLIGDYGFNFSGTREVALHKNNLNKLTTTYNSILTARMILTVIGFILMIALVLSFDRFTNNWKLYFLSYGIVFGNALFPTWFFQGVEKMKFITILSVTSKTLFTVSIFIFVKNSNDFLLVPLINSLGTIFIGFVALFLVNRRFNIPFKVQKIKCVVEQFKKGWYIFISKISTNLYTATTTFVLGLFTNNITVGYYSIAEKVVRITTSIFLPFTQAIYPHIVQLVKSSRNDAVLRLRQILKYTIIISICIWVLSYLFAEPLFYLVFGDNVKESIFIFKILSPLIIILPSAVILFNLTLLSFKMDKYFFKIYLSGAILNILLLVVFLYVLELSSVGAALSLLICELFLTIYALVLLKNKNVKLLF